MTLQNNNLFDILDEIGKQNHVTTEVFLPMIKKSVLVKELKTSEEIPLLDSNGTLATWNENLNRLIYSKVDTSISDPETIEWFKDYNSFLKHITSIDKVALITGLVQLSYDELPPKTVRCNNKSCQREYTITPTVEEAFDNERAFSKVWDKPMSILDYSWEFSFKIGGLIFQVTCKFPTEKDIADVMDYYKFDPTHQELLEKFGRLYTTTDELLASVKTIEIHRPNSEPQIFKAEKKPSSNLRENSTSKTRKSFYD